MENEVKEALFKKILTQQRDARAFAKYMISNFTDKDVSYLLSTKIIFKGNHIQPVTELSELPEIRVIDGNAVDGEISVKTSKIDNAGG